MLAGRALKRGEELGSRIQHILAAAGTFRELAGAFRSAVEALLVAAAHADGVEELLPDYVAESERLANLAEAFPDRVVPAP